MLCEQGHLLPHAWIAGDDEMGRNTFFRRDLNDLGEQYLLAVPSNTLIRDLDAAPPEFSGRGRPRRQPFQRVDVGRDALSEEAWTRIRVRDGENGPLDVEVATCRVQAKIDARIMRYEETLVVIRSLENDGVTKYDFYLSNASAQTLEKEFARVAPSAHRIEEAIKRSKSEAGLSHYEVRNWRGWYHHQVLSLIATWFLVLETHRGKKWTPAITLPQVKDGIAMLLRAAWQCDTPEHIARNKTRRLIRNEQARLYHWRARNRLPPLRVNQCR